MMNILFIGPKKGTSLDRANAYRRLGHTVTQIETRRLLPDSVWIDRLTWHVGDVLLSEIVLSKLRNELKAKDFDYCHVDGSEWLGPRAIRLLKRHCKKVINYNIDDPTGRRDRKRFISYRLAAPEYDLLCVLRDENVNEVMALGAKKVVRMRMTADEVNHSPRPLTEEDRRMWASEVLFLGTWMPERGPFLLKLIELGVPLTVRGANWNKAPEWEALKHHWKGGHLLGDDYAKAIQCAGVNLGLLSLGNRDQHTTRSAEIPALGGLLCAKRTGDHQQMYEEGIEAIFWSSAEECAETCLFYLNDPERRHRIASAGHARCVRSGYFNEPMCARLIHSAFEV